MDGDVHLVGNLFVHHAFGHCNQHVDFAFREFHVVVGFFFVGAFYDLSYLVDDFRLRVVDLDDAVVGLQQGRVDIGGDQGDDTELRVLFNKLHG